MGQKIPPYDDEAPDLGFQCEPLVKPNMSTIPLWFSGITTPYPNLEFYLPNGIIYLHPITTCTWQKDLFGLNGRAIVRVTMNIDQWNFEIRATKMDTLWPVYYHYSPTGKTWGFNQNPPAYFGGGRHQAYYLYSGPELSLAKLANNLNIDANQKTFAEFESMSADASAEGIRIARRYDGTNVYIKRA